MKIKIEIDTDELKKLVLRQVNSLLSVTDLGTGMDRPVIEEKDVIIEVRSRQNYRDKEWERGEFRAVLEKNI